MPQIEVAAMNGNAYRDEVTKYLIHRYGPYGIRLETEFRHGKKAGGQERRIDIVLYRASDNRILGLECKFQKTAGSVDQKVAFALRDLAHLSESMPCCLVYGGQGWSEGALHTLRGDPRAAYFEVPRSFTVRGKPARRLKATRELDDFVTSTFGLWHLRMRTEDT